jgi:hypothetical protein
MIPRHILAGALLSAVLVAPALAQTDSKWFVLRNHEVGNCWTATLVRIDGQYSSTFEQKAGGPYATQEQALTRLRELSAAATCTP